MISPLTVYIGYDAKEVVAFHVLAESIIRRTYRPMNIVPLRRQHFEQAYWRPRMPNESTEFSLTRFLVPYLSNYTGYSLFMDCDMLCLTDLNDILLYPVAYPDKHVFVCQHDYTPTEGTKFLGNVQTVYPRKNWSSVMLFNNALCTALTPEYVNRATGLELHRFQWTTDDKIGSLPIEYNWLVGEYEPNPNAKVLHYTLGGPWFDDTRNCDHADVWMREYLHLQGQTWHDAEPSTAT